MTWYLDDRDDKRAQLLRVLKMRPPPPVPVPVSTQHMYDTMKLAELLRSMMPAEQAAMFKTNYASVNIVPVAPRLADIPFPALPTLPKFDYSFMFERNGRLSASAPSTGANELYAYLTYIGSIKDWI